METSGIVREREVQEHHGRDLRSSFGFAANEIVRMDMEDGGRTRSVAKITGVSFCCFNEARLGRGEILRLVRFRFESDTFAVGADTRACAVAAKIAADRRAGIALGWDASLVARSRQLSSCERFETSLAVPVSSLFAVGGVQNTEHDLQRRA